MAITRVKTWTAGEILYASDLNTEFNNFITNAMDLTSPRTTSLDMDNYSIVLDGDGDSSITADTDDVIHFELQGKDLFIMDGDTASAVDGFTWNAAATASPSTVTMLAQGESTNITAQIRSKGSGNVVLADDSGNEMAIFTDVASAVNELTISNAATTANPTISCTGESDIGITLQNQDAEPMLVLDSVATSTNWVTISSAAAAADATIIGGAAGADAGLTIQGKGAGTLKLGDVPMVFPDSDGAADNYLMKTNGSGTMSFVLPAYTTGGATASVLPLPRSFLAGLLLSNGTDTDHDINIAVGECRNVASVNDTNMVVSTALGKQIDAIAAAGGTTASPTGGFPSGLTGGAVQNNTWYHVLLITDGTNITAGFDTSLTGANLIADHSGSGGSDLSGYTKYRRLGSVRTDGSANILNFIQHGDIFLYSTLPPLDVSSNDADYSSATQIALDYVPTGFRVEAIASIVTQDATNMILAGGDVTIGTGPNTVTADLATRYTGKAEEGVERILTDTAQHIYYWGDAVSDIYVQVHGWVDTRGRDD